MATPWYLENMGRSYPFLRNTTGRPTGLAPDFFTTSSLEAIGKDVVVDFGCTMGLDSGFVEGTHSVYLAKITRSSTLLTFIFHSDAPGLFGYELKFTGLTTDARFKTSFSEADIYASSAISESEACENDALWYGYLVLGDLSSLTSCPATILPSTSSKFITVEPALIRSSVGAYVRSINLANQDRTRATNPVDCKPVYQSCLGFESGTIMVNQRCLAGDVLLRPGYNCLIRQTTNNTIVIEASVGAGQGEPCSEVSLFAEETPPTNSSLLSGGPACNELVRTINGAGGASFTIAAGAGAVVTAEPSNHRIVVNVNMSQLAICAGTNPSDSISPDGPDYGDASCDCGPA